MGANLEETLCFGFEPGQKQSWFHAGSQPSDGDAERKSRNMEASISWLVLSLKKITLIFLMIVLAY